MTEGRGEGVNRAVSPSLFLSLRGDRSDARAYGSEPKARDGHAAKATRPAAIVARTFPFSVCPSSHEFTDRDLKTSSVIR